MTKLRVLAVAWGVAIIAGAAWLNTYRPRSPFVAHLLASEATHVVAHVVLYASLAVLVFVASSGWRGLVIAAVAVTAVLQEGAQSLPMGRLPGRGELFDLFVDALALVLALLACERWARPHTRVHVVSRS